MNNIINWTLDQIVADRFSSYSKYIIQERALPDVRDGLKTVQRRILYAMYNLRLFYNKPFKKSARIVGEVIGKYHPHGDTSIYDALVRISQSWKINMPLINMHGNNGSIDDDPPAAMRYTEVRLTEISQSMLENIESDCVDFVPNFDDSEREPSILPALFPNLLINGAKGIAAGFATEMPPHNLKEIISAIKLRIKSPNCRLDTMLNFVKGPDFPTGGVIVGVKGIYQALERGNGRIIIRSKYELNDSKDNPSITISEIPYGVVKSKLVKEIDLIRFQNKIYGIKEVRDESDRNGLKIYIKLIKNSNAKSILLYLLKKTQMQIFYSYNNVAISEKRPKQLSLINLIDGYIKHQKNVILSYSKFNLNKREIKLEIIEGLIKVSDNIDDVINLIKESIGTRQDIILELNAYGFSIIQAQAIVDLKLYRLSKTDKNLYLNEKKTLNIEIKELRMIINSDITLNNYLIQKLNNFSQKFGIPRRTRIEKEEYQQIEIKKEDLIKKQDLYMAISELGYIKSMSQKIYSSNSIGKYNLKDDDMLVYFNKITTLHKLLIFTNKGRFIKIPANLIEIQKFSSLGTHLNNISLLYENEKVIKCFGIENFIGDYTIVFSSKLGKIKRTMLKDYENHSFSRFFSTFTLSNEDEVVSISLTNNLQNIIIITNNYYSVKYSEANIPLTGCKSSGIKSIKLKENFVIGMTTINTNQDIGFISNKGGLRIINERTFSPSSRSSYGRKIKIFDKLKANLIDTFDFIIPSTSFLLNINSELIEGNFDDIKTSSKTVFTKNHSNMQGSIILNNIDEVKDSFLNDENTMEQKFLNAESKLDKISQLSIDELLKSGIK